MLIEFSCVWLVYLPYPSNSAGNLRKSTESSDRSAWCGHAVVIRAPRRVNKKTSTSLCKTLSNFSSRLKRRFSVFDQYMSWRKDYAFRASRLSRLHGCVASWTRSFGSLVNCVTHTSLRVMWHAAWRHAFSASLTCWQNWNLTDTMGYYWSSL